MVVRSDKVALTLPRIHVHTKTSALVDLFCWKAGALRNPSLPSSKIKILYIAKGGVDYYKKDIF